MGRFEEKLRIPKVLRASEEHDDRRCWVALRAGVATAGERCEELAAYEVYGLPLCEFHGAESKASALEELYFHASEDLQRPLNPEVAPIGNRAAAWALREAEGELAQRCKQAESGTVAALLRAWPFREEFTDPETLHYTWGSKEAEVGGPPEEWFRGPRLLIHKLMRLAFEEGESYLVELLEGERESTTAQLAYALADAKRKGHG